MGSFLFSYESYCLPADSNLATASKGSTYLVIVSLHGSHLLMLEVAANQGVLAVMGSFSPLGVRPTVTPPSPRQPDGGKMLQYEPAETVIVVRASFKVGCTSCASPVVSGTCPSVVFSIMCCAR